MNRASSDSPSAASARPGTRWRGFWRAALAACLGLAGAGVALADPPSRVGRVNWTEGNVTLQQAPDPERQAESVESPRNWPVTSGDVLFTGENARTEIGIGSTLVRLDQNTRIEVARLDDEAVTLRVVDGSVALRIRSDEQAQGVEVLAGANRLVPQGAGLFRVDARDGALSATAWRSDLRVDGGAGSFSLGSGQRAEFDGEGGWQRHGTPEIDRFASWAMNPDERFGEITNVSPEMTGADELDEHGEWSQHPEYGRVWAPNVVVADWAPYRYGRWAWVRPWGWTWVDAAPWGFAPFHYGRWVRWGPRWVWAPGTYVARPVYAPALVGWVGGPHASVSISFGPRVGWFPLAPHEIYSPYYHCSPHYVRHVNYSHVPRIERAELYVGGRRRVVDPPHHPYRYRDDRGAYNSLPGDAFRERGPRVIAVRHSPLLDSRIGAPSRLQPIIGQPARPPFGDRDRDHRRDGDRGRPGFRPIAPPPPTASLPRPPAVQPPRVVRMPGGPVFRGEPRATPRAPEAVRVMPAQPVAPQAQPQPSRGELIRRPVSPPPSSSSRGAWFQRDERNGAQAQHHRGGGREQQSQRSGGGGSASIRRMPM